MATLMNISMKDFRAMEKREEEYLKQWEKSRIIKSCKSCGQAYSFDKGEPDPKECLRCRGMEGDLIY